MLPETLYLQKRRKENLTLDDKESKIKFNNQFSFLKEIVWNHNIKRGFWHRSRWFKLYLIFVVAADFMAAMINFKLIKMKTENIFPPRDNFASERLHARYYAHHWLTQRAHWICETPTKYFIPEKEGKIIKTNQIQLKQVARENIA